MSIFNRKPAREAIPIAWNEERESDILLCKYENPMIAAGQQLLVRPGQRAIFTKGGILAGDFGPGTYTLTSGNLPGIFSEAPLSNGCYAAEVWYVSTTEKSIFWGTSEGITFAFGKQTLHVGASGSWKFQIDDVVGFQNMLGGSYLIYTTEELRDKFDELLEARFADLLSGYLTGPDGNIDLQKLSGNNRQAIAQRMMDDTDPGSLVSELNKYGIRLTNFAVRQINPNREEMAAINKLRENAFIMEQETKAEAGYIARRQLDILEKAAQNQGPAGAMTGMGLGMGLGMGFNAAGQMVGQNMGMSAPAAQVPPAPAAPAAPAAADDPLARLQTLKQLFEQGILTAEEYAAKRQAIIDKL